MDVTVLPTFLAVAVLICATPGPDMALCLSAGMSGGRPAATRAALGVACGVLVYALSAVAGAGTLAVAHPTVLAGLELFGAMYLLWLSASAVQAAVRSRAPVEPEDIGVRWFRRGLIVNVTNPKVLLFFVAVLPQFLGRSQNITLQLLMLALAFLLVGLTGDLAVGWTAWRCRGATAGRPASRRALGYASAAVFAVLAGVEAVHQLFP